MDDEMNFDDTAETVCSYRKPTKHPLLDNDMKSWFQQNYGHTFRLLDSVSQIPNRLETRHHLC